MDRSLLLRDAKAPGSFDQIDLNYLLNNIRAATGAIGVPRRHHAVDHFSGRFSCTGACIITSDVRLEEACRNCFVAPDAASSAFRTVRSPPLAGTDRDLHGSSDRILRKPHDPTVISPLPIRSVAPPPKLLREVQVLKLGSRSRQLIFRRLPPELPNLPRNTSYHGRFRTKPGATLENGLMTEQTSRCEPEKKIHQGLSDDRPNPLHLTSA